MKSEKEQQDTYWVAFTDLLSGVLLVVLLILFVAIFKMEDVRQQYQRLTDELRSEKAKVAEARKKAEALYEKWRQAQAEVERAKVEAEEARQKYESLLKALLMTKEQAEAAKARLREILGIRRAVVDALKKAFGPGQLDVDLDTGAIVLGEKVLFNENEASILPAKESYLASFLDKYISVLFDLEVGGGPFTKYLAEIVIEGHTNSNGTFLYNLKLSQERARNVLEFLLKQEEKYKLIASMPEPFSSSELDDAKRRLAQMQDLKKFVTATGRSFSMTIPNPVTGKEDFAKSRRIEFKFRLKDELLLDEIAKVLKGGDQ